MKSFAFLGYAGSMRIPKALLLACAPFAILACGTADSASGPEKVEIAVVDAPDALTSKAGDKLFKLTLTEASKSYALADISVDVGFPGETRTAVNFTIEDSNHNGLFDQGDSLNCTEPGVNLWDATSAAKTATVVIAERRDGTLFQIGTTNWTVTN